MTDRPSEGTETGKPARTRRDVPLTALLVSGAADARLLPESPFFELGLSALHAAGLTAANEALGEVGPQLLFVPVTIDEAPAAPLIARALAMRPAPIVVVVASNDEINGAAEAMRLGAFDCLFRPFSPNRLTKTIEDAIGEIPADVLKALAQAPPARTRRAAAGARRASFPDFAAGLVAGGPEIAALLATIESLARSDAPACITGEIGTGKGLIARRLHERSPHADAPYVTIACDQLTVENVRNTLGQALARAARGTLYLEEACNLAPEVQPLVVELLAEATPPGTARARLVTSSRFDLRAEMHAGRLRPELYYRLHVAALTIPPLRTRLDDIPLIVKAQLAELADTDDAATAGISAEAMQHLRSYDWPGNVSELLNVIWSAVAMHAAPIILPEHLPAEIAAAPTAMAATGGLGGLVGRSLADIEQIVIEATIRAEGGSVLHAARVLDVAPSTLYRKRQAWSKRTGGNTG